MEAIGEVGEVFSQRGDYRFFESRVVGDDGAGRIDVGEKGFSEGFAWVCVLFMKEVSMGQSVVPENVQGILEGEFLIGTEGIEAGDGRGVGFEIEEVERLGEVR
ncbi:hypothetical protein ES705_05511 [subsurface metagenome]